MSDYNDLLATVDPAIVGTISEDVFPIECSGDKEYKLFNLLLSKLVDDASFETTSRRTVKALYQEIVRLKANGLIRFIHADKLVPLLNEIQICIASTLHIIPVNYTRQDSLEDLKLEKEVMDQVTHSLYGCLISLHVVTTPNVVVTSLPLEDVLTTVSEFTRWQLTQALPVFSLINDPKSGEQISTSIENKLQIFYDNFCSLLMLLSEVIPVPWMPDAVISHLIHVSLRPLFAENLTRMQLSSLGIIKEIFHRYQDNRKSVFENILFYIIDSTSTDQSVFFTLKSGVKIQMITALVLNLVQCSCPQQKTLHDVKDTYHNLHQLADFFVANFIGQCIRTDDQQFKMRSVFSNFVKDVKLLLIEPQYPAAELYLNLIVKNLKCEFAKKSKCSTLSAVYIDHLCEIVLGLYDSKKMLQNQSTTIDEIIQKRRSTSGKTPQVVSEDVSDKDICFLQKFVLGFLAAQSEEKDSVHAYQFCAAQWYCHEVTTASPRQEQKTQLSSNKHYQSSKSEHPYAYLEDILIRSTTLVNKTKKSNSVQKAEKQEILSSDATKLVFTYLVSSGPLLQTAEESLLLCLCVAFKATSIPARVKAIKCFTQLVLVGSPKVKGTDLQNVIKRFINDGSSAVRNATLDLFEKYLLPMPDQIDLHSLYIAHKMYDASLSVRKKAAKIIKEICIQHPNHKKVPVIYLSLLNRSADEFDNADLVTTLFHETWFLASSDETKRTTNIKVITEVINRCLPSNLEKLEKQLSAISASRKNKSAYQLAAKDLFQFIAQHRMKPDAELLKPDCYRFLLMLSKICPESLVHHCKVLHDFLLEESLVSSHEITLVIAITNMLPHLQQKQISQEQDHLLKDLKNRLLQITMCPSIRAQTVVKCFHCLSLIIHEFSAFREMTHELYADCYEALSFYNTSNDKEKHGAQINPDYLNRRLILMGLLLQHFELKEITLQLPSPEDKKVLYDMIMQYVKSENDMIRLCALHCIGSASIVHDELMLRPDVQTCYHAALSNSTNECEKLQVITNLTSWVKEKDKKLSTQKDTKHLKLKEIINEAETYISATLQTYLPAILKAYFDSAAAVRASVAQFVTYVVFSGGVHPMQLVSHLICMTSDHDLTICIAAQKQLKYIYDKSPELIQIKQLEGLALSFKLQQKLYGDNASPVIRGYKIDAHHVPRACNEYMYLFYKTKKLGRHKIIESVLKQIIKELTSYSQAVYYADNLAYFPYEREEDVLFVINLIDKVLALSGFNTLQSWKTEFGIPMIQQRRDSDDAEDSSEYLYQIINRLSHIQNYVIQELLSASKTFMLLILLKNHLKSMYGIHDSKMAQYSIGISEGKNFQNHVKRKEVPMFNVDIEVPILNHTLDQDLKLRITEYFLRFEHLMLSSDSSGCLKCDDTTAVNDTTNKCPKKRAEVSMATHVPEHVDSPAEAVEKRRGRLRKHRQQEHKSPVIPVKRKRGSIEY